jgi:hypothetical protein
MTLRSRTPLTARDPLPIPDRYCARFDERDEPTELTIFDEAADGAGSLTTWVSADDWVELEDAR